MQYCRGRFYAKIKRIQQVPLDAGRGLFVSILGAKASLLSASSLPVACICKSLLDQLLQKDTEEKKCSDQCNFPSFLGNHDRPTDQSSKDKVKKDYVEVVT